VHTPPPVKSLSCRYSRRAISTSLLLASILLATGPAFGAKRSLDDEVVVSGIVTNLAGEPVAGATVELRGKHLGFSLRDFQIKRRGGRTSRAVTDASGSFEILWSWHSYYHRFELVAGVPLGAPQDSEGLLELGRVDISRRMKNGDPVVVTIEIGNTQAVDSLREFIASLTTADERQVYQEMGKPDKVRHTKLATDEETSWWYFDQGKVYIFRNGRKDIVEEFEPIPQFAG
jgi:hypothetical protein